MVKGLRSLVMVPVAGVLADGLGPVPSVSVDIGTVGGDRVLRGGRVYEVATNSTFKGTKAGESGMIVASGETAYIHIAKGVTLSCEGTAGSDAGQGGSGALPSSKKPDGISEYTEYGVTWREIEFAPASAGGGGKGATGGGAGIEVPIGSGLVVYGDGNLIAKGGEGGNAAAGGAGALGAYYIVTWFANDQEDPIKLYSDWEFRLTQLDEEAITNAPGPVSGAPTEGRYLTGTFAQPATGGGGGGGAGGGGAAIGSRGADGSTGGSGGAVSGTISNPRTESLSVVTGAAGAAASSAGECGSVWIGLSSSGSPEFRQGMGGIALMKKPVEIARDWVEFLAYDGDGQLTDPVRILFDNGQPGGLGGNGGPGAEIGSGGNGGQGGQGGFGGGVTSYVKQDVPPGGWVKAVPGNVGTNGSPGVARGQWKIPVHVRDSEGNLSFFESLGAAVDSIGKNPAAYGSTITVIGSVTGENAKVPSGTTVIVEKDEYFREPGPGDLRQSYYLHPVPCDTNGDSRTYHYTFNTNQVVPVIGAFAFRTNKEAKCEAVITVTNALKELYYRPFSSATLRDFKPEGGKTNVTENGRLTVTAGATEGKRFYRVGVTDDPR